MFKFLLFLLLLLLSTATTPTSHQMFGPMIKMIFKVFATQQSAVIMKSFGNMPKKGRVVLGGLSMYKKNEKKKKNAKQMMMQFMKIHKRKYKGKWMA